MLSLFHSYWWLVFPLSWFVVAAWRAWLAGKARRDTLELIQTFVRTGQAAPPELLDRLNKA